MSKILTENEARRSVVWENKPTCKPTHNKRRLEKINFELPTPGNKDWEKAIIKAFKHPGFTFTPSKDLHKMPKPPKSLVPGVDLIETPSDKNDRQRRIDAKRLLIKLHAEKHNEK